MQLHHVSEEGGIERFEPRPAPHGEPRRLVWAVDTGHLPNYLVPRDCPRVCFRAAAQTSEQDRLRFLGRADGPVVAIEAAWLERAGATPLWIYELPADTFECADANAGYFVSPSGVTPLGRRRIEQPLA